MINNNHKDLNDSPVDIRLSILSVAEKCGIDYDEKPITHGVFSAKCPFCESASKKMYLTTKSKDFVNMYICHKCHKSGNAITLYAEIKGLSFADAKKELLSNKTPSQNKKIEKLILEADNLPDCLDTADISKLDKVYKDFLNLLSLNSSSYKNLKDRGVTDDFIKENGYKSLPSNYKERYSITDKLIAIGHDLKGVPGFYIDSYNHWTFTGIQGYLIPIRDLEDRITSFQIRMNEKIGDLRYTYFTSSKKITGAKAICAPSVCYGEKGTKDICITEGPLKGAIASYFSKETYISVPGVNSAIDILIDYLKELNPIRAIICYDMDMYETIEVKKALLKLMKKLDEVGIYYEIKLWDKNYKGIDEYEYYRFLNQL